MPNIGTTFRWGLSKRRLTKEEMGISQGEYDAQNSLGTIPTDYEWSLINKPVALAAALNDIKALIAALALKVKNEKK